MFVYVVIFPVGDSLSGAYVPFFPASESANPIPGSFNSSEVQFSRLAPPHQWASEGIMGTESQSMWHGAATLSLLPQASDVCFKECCFC